jgi:hypothetical protein
LNTTTYDPNAVWLEGTAHTIAALTARSVAGGGGFQKRIEDLKAAVALVKTCEAAQAELGPGQTINGKPIASGNGLVAATSPMDTGFGYGYFPNLHIGATGWYLIAAQGGNPFRLGYESFRS